MRYRALGASGLRVSEIVLGTHVTFAGQLERSDAGRLVDAALDLGVNLFDTADVYGNGATEELLGELLAGTPRGRFAIATKCFFPCSSAEMDRGLSRKHVFDAVHATLRRMRIDYIDLFQCHRFDPATPLAETVQAMTDLVRQGKILHWGVGRCTAAQIGAVCAAAEGPGLAAPIAHQTFYNLFSRQAESGELRAAATHGLGTLVYAPLAQGVLTGKYRAADGPPAGSRAGNATLREGMWDFTTEKLTAVDALRPIARDSGCSIAGLAVAWCLRRPEVAACLCGATRPEQLVETAAATEVKLSPDTLERIDAVFAGIGISRGAEEPHAS